MDEEPPHADRAHDEAADRRNDLCPDRSSHGSNITTGAQLARTDVKCSNRVSVHDPLAEAFAREVAGSSPVTHPVRKGILERYGQLIQPRRRK